MKQWYGGVVWFHRDSDLVVLTKVDVEHVEDAAKHGRSQTIAEAADTCDDPLSNSCQTQSRALLLHSYQLDSRGVPHGAKVVRDMVSQSVIRF